ncbi:DEAD/DEAH box helicase family protein [bacterium]|nr:DEAD/DEAH box helicase family protein [bacterium]
MRFELRNYQQEVLDVIRDYMRECSKLDDAKAAYEVVRTRRNIRTSSYLDLEEYEDLRHIPYFCVRIPTGGGKTIVGCHAAGVIAHEYLHTARPLVLWLTPNKTIRDQTILALQNRNHPYYAALSEQFETFYVLSGKEGMTVSRGTIEAGATIVVTTIQSSRVADDELRKVYEDNGSLLEHFPESEFGSFTPIHIREDGSFPKSFANLLRKKRPIVIVDEAHNVRTELSFETLNKFAPSCILELTATPHQGDAQGRGRSNVLYSVNAHALRAEEMIKMPIIVRTLQDWRIALSHALDERQRLEKLCAAHAEASGEFIRPILLIQAESASQTESRLTPSVLQQWLIENEKFESKEECPIATGKDDELANRDILSRQSSIKCVITQQKLREGWDCPWAYVMCTVAPARTATAVEQILGRIMRMPGAKRKPIEDLNHAYAYSVGGSFEEVAQRIVDGLVQIGYDKWQAKDFIKDGGSQEDLPLFDERKETERKTTYAPLRIPQLCEETTSGLFELIDETQMLDTDWSLEDFDFKLSESEYRHKRPTMDEGKIDFSGTGKLKYQRVSGIQLQLDRLGETRMSEADLLTWLVKQTRNDRFPPSELRRWVLRVMNHLKGERGLTEQELILDRHQLREALIEKLNKELKSLKLRNLQGLLSLGEGSRVVTSDEIPCVFDPDEPYRSWDKYDGPMHFNKHFYSWVGNLNWEEAQCASILDRLPEVEVWLRNPVKEGFRLPTSTDYFYPDFVARLIDGRYLVVEYKGEVDWTNDDSKEKRLMGEAWANHSNGKCVFVMPGGPTSLENTIVHAIKQGLTSTDSSGQTRIN